MHRTQPEQEGGIFSAFAANDPGYIDAPLETNIERGIRNTNIRFAKAAQGRLLQEHLQNTHKRLLQDQAAEQITQYAASEDIARTAEQMVSVTARTSVARQATAVRQKENNKAATRSHLSGPVFWFIVALAVLKDLLDVIFTLTILLSIFSSVFAVLVSLIILLYLSFSGVPLTIRKAVSFFVTLLIEFIPFISFLPLATINLFLIRHFDRMEKGQKSIVPKFMPQQLRAPMQRL
ncbi:hypothetical protein KC727_00115 [Candidatus Kaiserbacteria bacterium]|nr:hypothetical protein [Candidatus Kaiserbacteria bacterium]